MEIAVLGGGMVGSLIATELSKNYDVTVFDNNKLDLENVNTVVKDVTNTDFKNEILKYELSVNCLPGFMGFQMLKTLIELELSCVDISFMPEDCLTMDKKMNCTIIPDAGIAPGLSNLIVGNMVSKNKIKEIEIMVGGLPKEQNPPWNYLAPFSPIDVIEEYTRPARAKINGEIITKEALSDIRRFEVEGIGELEAFLTDGLRTLLNSDEKIKNIPNLGEYTIRYPGHADLIKKLIHEGAFSDKIVEYNNKKMTMKEKTCLDLFSQWELKDEDEFTFMIILGKTENGREISYTIYDERRDGWSSMSRTTGLTACAFTELLINNKIAKKGIQCPEVIGQNEKNYNFVLDYLTEKGIVINQN
jgi:saccharopine dehydrogenase-like NADP-dependent oxidoreductase